MKKLLVGLVVAGLLAAALPAASVAAANHAGGMAKVTICHVGADGSQHTLSVGTPAANAHLAHHTRDLKGACPGTTPQQTSCTFAAADSLYVVPPYTANGTFGFTWRLSDGVVTSGYWNENYPANSGQIFPYTLSGTVVGNNVSLMVVQLTVPLLGTLSNGVFNGYTVISATHYTFTATGTKTCS